MKFEIIEYDLQANGIYGNSEWSFNNGELYITYSVDKGEYYEFHEMTISIDPFSNEKDIENALANAGAHTPWKITKKRKIDPNSPLGKMVKHMAINMMRQLNSPMLFGRLAGKDAMKGVHTWGKERQNVEIK